MNIKYVFAGVISAFVSMRGLLPLVGLALVSCRYAPLSSTSTGSKPHLVLASQQIAADIKPQALWDARTFKRFVSMDFPKMLRASQASFLSDKEYILGVSEHGESRAYPIRFMAFHHIINDRIGTSRRGKIPVAISFCSNCNVGIRYDPRLHGQTLKFDFFGLYNGIAALCERQTQSVFLLGEGRVISGPLMGMRLKTAPLLDTTWGAWKKLHPDTLVMSQNTPFKEFYGAAKVEGKRHAGGSVYSFLGATVTRGDKRLSPFDLVLAVTLVPNAKLKKQSLPTPLHRAYPIQALERAGGVVNDMMGNKPVGILLDPQTQTVVALSRQLGALTLTLEPGRRVEGLATCYDRETRTRWNLEGKGEEGPLKGKTLPRLDNHLSQWYGWAASFPDTSIYGRSDPPQPDNPFVEGRRN